VSFEKFIAYGVCVEPYQGFKPGKTYRIIGRFEKQYAVLTDKGSPLFVAAELFGEIKSEVDHIKAALKNICPDERSDEFRHRIFRIWQELFLPAIEARISETKDQFENSIHKFIAEISDSIGGGADE